MTRHFDPPDYHSKHFKEILERTQDVLVDYLTNMNALFRRHGSISKDVQLDIIVRNLLPFYTTQLPVVHLLEELEGEGLKLEAKQIRVDHYVSPSRKRCDFVEPDFAFISSTSNLPSAAKCYSQSPCVPSGPNFNVIQQSPSASPACLSRPSRDSPYVSSSPFNYHRSPFTFMAS